MGVHGDQALSNLFAGRVIRALGLREIEGSDSRHLPCSSTHRKLLTGSLTWIRGSQEPAPPRDGQLPGACIFC